MIGTIKLNLRSKVRWDMQFKCVYNSENVSFAIWLRTVIRNTKCGKIVIAEVKFFYKACEAMYLALNKMQSLGIRHIVPIVSVL